MKTKRGQASIEFVLLLAMILLLLHTLVLPHYFLSKQVMTDSQQFSQIRLDAQQLASAMNDVAAGGVGSKRTVRLLLSDHVFLGCTNSSNTPWYPSAWGPQRLTFYWMSENTQNPPLSLPYSTTSGDPAYAVMVKNGGACYPLTDDKGKTYLQCFGTIPVNTSCDTIADFTLSGPNKAINSCQSVFGEFCGGTPHAPQVVDVVVKKELINSTPTVTVTSTVSGA